MLGKGADYFLHPKIEKKAVKPINSKLRKEGGGCWSGLRYEAVFAAFYMLKNIYIYVNFYLPACVSLCNVLLYHVVWLIHVAYVLH